MDIQELAILVKSTRSAQKDYFATRDTAVLTKSKLLEKQLDEVVKEILEPHNKKNQSKLF